MRTCLERSQRTYHQDLCIQRHPFVQFTITTGHIDKIKDAKTKKSTPLELYKITNNDKIQERKSANHTIHPIFGRLKVIRSSVRLIICSSLKLKNTIAKEEGDEEQQTFRRYSHGGFLGREDIARKLTTYIRGN